MALADQVIEQRIHVMRTARFAVCAVALLLFQGCASRSEGTDQTITVETSPTGANCRFYRQATGIVLDQVITPGDVVVEKTEDDMTVECEKEGYETVKATSRCKNMATSS